MMHIGVVCVFSAAHYRESENSGLDCWTRLLDCLLAGFVFRVTEPKLNFFLVLRAGYLSSYVSIGDFDNHEE